MLVMVATALYIGFISPNSQASVSGALRAFGQCRVNTYDCRDFTTQFEAQAVYWACGGRQNDVHRLDRDRDGWACEALR
jgi:Excalibur calcium-binding domain